MQLNFCIIKNKFDIYFRHNSIIFMYYSISFYYLIIELLLLSNRNELR